MLLIKVNICCELFLQLFLCCFGIHLLTTQICSNSGQLFWCRNGKI